MARLNAANFAESTLSAQVLDNALEFPVQTGHGVRFPTPPFRVVIYTGANKEIVEITSVSTDSLICDNINKRALEGTSAIQHESGSVIENAFTAGAHEELADDDHVHGDITNDGKIGTTEDLVIVTGASGVLTAKTAGTSAQFLRGDGSWAEPASGGLTDENKVQIRMFGKVI